MNYFVTAIGTDSGKTVISALLTEMLQADYWKPIQSGSPRDTDTVRKLVSNDQSKFYQEQYLLNTPASPHAAAEIDGVQIKLDQIVAPVSNRDLVMEGAGGVMVPINEKELIIDVIKRLRAEVILVSNFYLGSINHTLLTIEALKNREINVRGVIFNGEHNASSESIILKMSGLKKLFHLEKLDQVNAEIIYDHAKKLRECWDS